MEFAANAARAAQSSVVMRAKRLLARAKRDPQVAELVRMANEAILSCKAINPGTVHTNSVLSTISIQYKNEDFIGTQLCPIVPVDKPGGIFYRYSKRDRLATPDDSVGVRSMPNEISENRTTDSYATSPYALKDFVAERTLQAQDAPLNEMIDLIAAVTDAIDLREEMRIATVMTTAANFTANTTLSGTSQWSDYVNSDPNADIIAGRDQIWSGMNGATRLVGYCGLDVYNKLRNHPKVIANFKHLAGLKLPTRQQLAEYFELDDLLVARAWQDTANEGQSISTGRIWGKHFGMVRVAQAPSIRTAGFAYTMRFGQKVTTQWYDPAPGVEGGYHGKVGLEEQHKVCAADAGYLVVNATA